MLFVGKKIFVANNIPFSYWCCIIFDRLRDIIVWSWWWWGMVTEVKLHCWKLSWGDNLKKKIKQLLEWLWKIGRMYGKKTFYAFFPIYASSWLEDFICILVFIIHVFSKSLLDVTWSERKKTYLETEKCSFDPVCVELGQDQT